MVSLTHKQQAVFDFIFEYYQEHNFVPNYPDIQEEFGFSSSNSIYQYLDALKRKNYLKETAEGYEIAKTQMGIPILGIIVSGDIQYTDKVRSEKLPVEIILDRITELFALQVSGDSMRDSEIREGDYIILEKREPKNGEIGAIVSKGEITLQQVQKNENGVTLLPKNQNYIPVHITLEEWEQVQCTGTFLGKAWKDGQVWHATFRI